MAQFLYIEWLALWLMESIAFEFQWDEGNSSKSVLKHGVSTDEVEEVFESGVAVALGMQILPPIDEERLAVIGPTNGERIITVVFTLRSGKVKPISSRPSNRMERKIYEAIRKISE